MNKSCRESVLSVGRANSTRTARANRHSVNCRWRNACATNAKRRTAPALTAWPQKASASPAPATATTSNQQNFSHTLWTSPSAVGGELIELQTAINQAVDVGTQLFKERLAQRSVCSHVIGCHFVDVGNNVSHLDPPVTASHRARCHRQKSALHT
jgi:hypothetical protein